MSQHWSLWFVANMAISFSHNRLRCLNFCSLLCTFNYFSFASWDVSLFIDCLLLYTSEMQAKFSSLHSLHIQLPFMSSFIGSLLLYNVAYVVISSLNLLLTCYVFILFIMEVYLCQMVVCFTYACIVIQFWLPASCGINLCGFSYPCTQGQLFSICTPIIDPVSRNWYFVSIFSYQ